MASRIHGLVSEGASGAIAYRPVVLDVGADGLSFLSRDGERIVLIPFSCLKVQRAATSTQGWVLRGLSPFPAVHLRDPDAIASLRGALPPHVGRLLGSSRSRRPHRSGRFRSIAVAALLVTLLGVIGMVSIDANPSLMTSAVRNLPAAFESRLGDAALNRVRADALDLDDDVIVAAVQEITQRLLFEVEDIPFDFRVAIVASSESDLILFPGGRMLLSSGLLEEVETPEEMAAILAHQIQHAIRRHPLILFERWLISAKSFDVWAVVFGYDPKAVASYVKSMSSMQFNRFQELEADIAAGDLLARVGVPPHTLAKFMRRCSEVSAAAGFCQHHSGIPTHGEDSDEDVGQPSQAFGDIDWSAVQRRVRLTTQ